MLAHQLTYVVLSKHTRGCQISCEPYISAMLSKREII